MLIYSELHEKNHMITYVHEKISRRLSRRNAHVSRNLGKLRHQLLHPGRTLDLKAKDLIWKQKIFILLAMKPLTFRLWDKIHAYERISQCKWKAQTIHRDRHFFFKVCDMVSIRNPKDITQLDGWEKTYFQVFFNLI